MTKKNTAAINIDAQNKQFAALPYTKTADGSILVWVTTSRQSHQWILPKGHPEKGMKPYAVAAMEAEQEIGIIGSVAKKPVGTLSYNKIDYGAITPCTIDVYLLRVTRQLKKWQERNQRNIKQVTVDEALSLLSTNTNFTDKTQLSALFDKVKSILALPEEPLRSAMPHVDCAFDADMVPH